MLDVITLISLLVIISLLRRIAGVLPSVFSCAVRWKENVNLDSSVKLSRDRDITALALIIPFCIIVTNSGIHCFRFMGGLSAEASFGIILGILITYFLFRMFTEKVFLPSRRRRSARVSDNSDRTFFIILALTLIFGYMIFGISGMEAETSKRTMLWISAAIYMLYIVRKFQIFQTSHSILTSFLYLCALEIIPTGTLVVSAIIF